MKRKTHLLLNSEFHLVLRKDSWIVLIPFYGPHLGTDTPLYWKSKRHGDCAAVVCVCVFVRVFVCVRLNEQPNTLFLRTFEETCWDGRRDGSKQGLTRAQTLTKRFKKK